MRWRDFNILHEFYLSSIDIDIGANSRPRKCELVKEVTGMRANSHYLLVKVSPPLITRFWDGPVREFDRIILSIIGERTMQEAGVRPVFVDVVLCPDGADSPIDERSCSRIGTGHLHATYVDALKDSPVEGE
jgi:hypothetical protein